MKRGQKIAVLLGLCVLMLTGCKSSDYQKASDLLAAGNYDEAKAIFTELGDYKDSADMVKECDYEAANAMAESKDYDNAIAAFEALGDYKDSADRVHQCNVQKANDLLASGEYEKAADILTEEYKTNNDPAIADSICTCIENLLEAGKREEAEKYLGSVKDYDGAKDVQNLAIFLTTEDLYKNGTLNAALVGYKTLPEDYKHGDIAVAGRIEKLESHPDFLAVCGQWGGGGDDIASIKQISTNTGAWDSWELEVEKSSYLTILCTINDDDTVTMQGVVPFMYCTNFSSIAANIKVQEGKKQFTYTGDSLPDSIEVDDGFELSCSEDEFRLDYDITDESVSLYFDYQLYGSAVFDTIITNY